MLSADRPFRCAVCRRSFSSRPSLKSTWTNTPRPSAAPSAASSCGPTRATTGAVLKSLVAQMGKTQRAAQGAESMTSE